MRNAAKLFVRRRTSGVIKNHVESFLFKDCTKTFTQKKNLKRHIKEKHENLNQIKEKPVECKQSKLNFASREKLPHCF